MEKTRLPKNESGKWDCSSFSLGEDDDRYSCGFPWPPKYYTCSFCKREFKSAQALGGHMNVHRRERARLRLQLPSSWVCEYHNPKPNSNPNPNFSSPSHPYNVHLSLFSPSVPSSSSSMPWEKGKIPLVVPQVGDLTEGKTKISPPLELGGVSGMNMDKEFKDDPKEVVDLELRLGCF
ncbi:hypothetical protein SLE2022_246860 [Rubroshorea leprosula]